MAATDNEMMACDPNIRLILQLESLLQISFRKIR